MISDVLKSGMSFSHKECVKKEGGDDVVSLLSK